MVAWIASGRKGSVIHKVEVSRDFFKSLPANLLCNGTVAKCWILGPVIADLWHSHQPHHNAEAKVSPDLLFVCGPCNWCSLQALRSVPVGWWRYWLVSMWQAQVELLFLLDKWAIHANQVCGASPTWCASVSTSCCQYRKLHLCDHPSASASCCLYKIHPLKVHWRWDVTWSNCTQNYVRCLPRTATNSL